MMKKSRAKLTALILALSCCTACVGAGVALSIPQTASVTASAEEYSTYTVTKLGATGSSDASTLYLYTLEGDDLPKEDKGSWDHEYELEAGSGVSINGQAAAHGAIKLPGDLYLPLTVAASEGDVITINGTYYNEEKAVKFIFDNCQLQWNGSAWVEYVETPKEPEIQYTIYDMGELLVHNNSTGATANVPRAAQLYMKSTLVADLPFKTWDDKFTLESGDGWMVNGDKVSTGRLISANEGLFVDLTNANVKVGDVVSVSGTFVHETQAVKYVIAESKFVWNGTAWKEYVAYTTHELGTLSFAQFTADKNFVYFAPQNWSDDMAANDGTGGWETKFHYKGGVGINLNGTALNVTVKFPGSMFIEMPSAPSVGDVLKIGGTFYNTDSAIQFIITESTFTWNGSAWVGENTEVPVDPTEGYATYTVTKIGAATNSTAGVLYAYALEGDDLPKDEGDWDNVFELLAGSGKGVSVNGTVVGYGAIKQPGDLYLPLNAAVNAGDVLTLDGVFYCEAKEVKFVFDNCSLKWDGSVWTPVGGTPDQPDEPDEPAGEYTTYTVTKVGATNASNATDLYLYSLGGDELPKSQGDWDNVYTLLADSGAGLTLNGNTISMGDIKFPGDFFMRLGTAAVAGDVIVLDGAYYNETTGIKIVFDNCTLQFNGSAWVEYIPGVEYATHEIGKLSFQMIGSNGVHAYFLKENGEALPIYSTENNLHWDTVFDCKSGNGVTINGQPVKNVVVKFPSQMFIDLRSIPKAGDVLTIGGVFYNNDIATQYIIENTSFEWTGSMWIPLVEYTDYEIGTLVVAGNQTSSSSLYLKKEDGSNFAVSNTFTFHAGSGLGLALNGLSLDVTQITVSNNQMFINLGTAAKDGDVLTIEGKFYNLNTGAQYVIAENNFVYVNGVWSVYVSNYDEIGIGEVLVDNDASTKQYIYLNPANGDVQLPVDSWDDPFVCAYGAGVTLNNEAVDVEILSIDGAIYLSLAKGAKVGDKLSIGGKFVCETQGILYYIVESKFEWTGENWKPVINYTETKLGELVLFGNSANASTAVAGALHFKASNYEITNDNFTLQYESGTGFTVNGVQKPFTFVNHVDGCLFLTFADVQEGDIIKIGGKFVCPERKIMFVIEDTTFTWDGEWLVPCEEFEVGAVVYEKFDSNANGIYVLPSDNKLLPVTDWNAPFVAVNGNGITLNGQPIDYTNSVKSLGGSMFIAIGRAPVEGDVLKIEGTLRCVAFKWEYVIEETTFTYQNGTWVNQLYGVRAEKKAALDAHFATFAEADYYASEWQDMQDILRIAKNAIDGASVVAKVNAIYDAAIAEMNAVVTKADVDAHFGEWKNSAKADIEAYKNAALYREAEQIKIAEIVAKAKTDIDACETATALKYLVSETKAALDALYTAEEWDVAEAYVAAVKAELASYKSESNYKAEQWASIQAIIESAYAKIDAVIGDNAAVAQIVKTAKASMDNVKTSAQVDAEQAVVSAAKAELASYKVEDDYNAKEWNEIQSIIQKAYADIDEAIGDDQAIADIVTAAKAKMDKVLKSDEANAKALETARASVKAEIMAYVAAIDYSVYTEESVAKINGYIAAAMQKLESATEYSQLENLAAELKAQIGSVEKIEQEKKGCGSVVGLTTAVTLLAAAAIALGKKKED